MIRKGWVILLNPFVFDKKFIEPYIKNKRSSTP